ncbi:MAG TPA: TonB-dependent receptor [Holophagaceae bacterium]|nr:TonB-dependent receptor [Holophagaceae bacterium]
MNRVVSRLGLTAIAIVAGSVAGYAQSSTTGSVSGVVTDDKGAPLAGATVTLTSAQVTRTATTGSDGSYRLGLLNPGSWSVRVSKDGFQTITQRVDVATNENRQMNMKLPATGSTTVVITTTVPVVDLTSTTTGQNVSMESVAAVPKGRDFTSMAFFAPGVVSGGSNYGNGSLNSSPSISGASSAENSFVLDGLVTSDFRYGGQGASLKTDFIDQVEVQTGGFRPEFSALGGVFNAVTKSGSNDFKGSAWLTWDAIGIQAVSKRNSFFRQSPPNSRYDLGAEVGGAFIKDKLFYFFGVDGDITESKEDFNNQGLKSDKAKTNNYQTLAKINWYITQDLQLTFFANYNNVKTTQDTLRPTNGDANLGGPNEQKTLNFTANLDWTISPALLLSVKVGHTDDKQTFDPTGINTIALSDPNYFATGPGRAGGPSPYAGTARPGTTWRSGGTGYFINQNKGVTNQLKADLSWFLGTHSLKFGLSWLQSEYTEVARTSGDFLNDPNALRPQDLGYGYSFGHGERDILRINGAGNFNGLDRQFLSTNATVKAEFTAFYAQDQWEIIPGFRLMYGFRYEKQDQKDLNGKSFMKYDKFQDVTQPRVGFTWDVNNDGKNKVSGSYATYYEQIPQRVAIRVFANETYLRFRYSAARTTYDVNTGNYTITNPTPNSVTDFATPFSFDPIALNTKLPQRDEFTLGYDHSFENGWTAGIHGKYRKLKNPIEDMVLTDAYGDPYDEGPAIVFDAAGNPIVGAGAAILGNPGQFQEWHPNPKSMTYYYLSLGAADPYGPGYNAYGIYIPQYYNASRDVFSIHTTGQQNYGYDDHAGNTYQSVDFTLDKRTDRDYIAFSYTWSRLQGSYEGVVSSSNGQPDGNITASFDYYPYVGYGLLPLDRTNVAKLQFSHRFTAWGGNDLNIGGAWTYQSGTPQSYFDDGSSTTIQFPDGSYGPVPDAGGYGNATPQNFQLGQIGRNPSTNQVDLHADYVWKLAGKFRLIPSVDLFNAFNSRLALGSVDQATDAAASPNAAYRAENGWQTGRRWRFGVKFQF